MKYQSDKQLEAHKLVHQAEMTKLDISRGLVTAQAEDLTAGADKKRAEAEAIRAQADLTRLQTEQLRRYGPSFFGNQRPNAEPETNQAGPGFSPPPSF
jgi:hypothetical protein